jgi:hypothetical protein
MQRCKGSGILFTLYPKVVIFASLLVNAISLDNKTRNCFTEKVESSLHFLSIMYNENIYNFDETSFMMGKIMTLLVVTGLGRRDLPKAVQSGNCK